MKILLLFYVVSAMDCFQPEPLDRDEQAACLDIASKVMDLAGLSDVHTSLEQTRHTCRSIAEERMQMYGCYALIDLVLETYTRVVAGLAGCIQLTAGTKGEACDVHADFTSEWLRHRITQVSEGHRDSPLSFVSSKLEETLSDWPTLQRTGQRIDELMQFTFHWFEKMSDYIRWNTWRTLHWTWLQDSLHSKRVVHTTWGPIEHWATLGAHDAANTYALEGPSPLFHISNMSSVMRWDVVRALIKNLGVPHDQDVNMVEVGVFVGHLSKFVLSDAEIPNVMLMGVDPYIGNDDTFPGNYSQSMSAEEPYLFALSTYNEFPGRAKLAATKSADVAPLYPNNSVDILFLDGCHFYHCIKEDLELWLPKVRPGGVVSGHDFSPQWPGVVRAVYELRGNQVVNLGMDWTYWWHKE